MTGQDLEYLGRAARLIIILFCYGIQMHTPVHQMLVPGTWLLLDVTRYQVSGTWYQVQRLRGMLRVLKVKS